MEPTTQPTHDSNMDKAEADLQLEDVTSQKGDVAPENPSSLSPTEQRRVLRKVDFRLVIPLGFCYAMSFLDRSNLGFASISGMTKDLHLSVGTRYSTIALIFYPSYILFESLAVLTMRWIGPRIFISTCTLFWGATIIGAGFAKSWASLIPVRVLLGLLESGILPGSLYFLLAGYPRDELYKRNAMFVLAATLSSAFGGVLAYGLGQMDGVSGLRGWRWIFIIEGVITCAVAIGAFFFLLDFPETADRIRWFLSTSEKNFVVDRIDADRKDVTVERFSFKAYLSAANDTQMWMYALMNLFMTTPGYALSYFLPIILREDMDFSLATSQCLIAPPYLFSIIIMLAQAEISNTIRSRAIFIIFDATLTVVGVSMLGFTTTPGVRYTGAFLATAGFCPGITALFTYQANNIRGQWKRAFCSASLVAFGGIGAVVGSLVYRSQDSPKYWPGLIASLVCGVLTIVFAVLNTLLLARRNKSARDGKILEGLEEFRYTYYEIS